MIRTRLSGWVGVVMMVAMAAVVVGCADPADKREISALDDQSKGFAARNAELQRQLDRSMRENNDLQRGIAERDQTIGELRSQASAPPPPPQRIVVKETVPAPAPTKTASGWEQGASGDRVTIGTDILFTPGSATLSAAGEKALSKIADDLKREYAGMRVRVYGYTDSDPIVKTKNKWQDNLELSLNRSAAVTRFLQSKGVTKDRIETVGMGDTHFVASNANKDGKAKNRRVEIVVVKTK